ncbi:hypothetical protein ABZ543_13300 [Streptomyces roseifaciens]
MIGLGNGVVVDDFGRMKIRKKPPQTFFIRVQNKVTGQVSVTEVKEHTLKDVRNQIFRFDVDRGTNTPRIGAEIWKTHKHVSKRVGVYAGGVTAVKAQPQGHNSNGPRVLRELLDI